MEFKPLASSSSGNCYILSDGDSQTMIEAGIPWSRVQAALNFKTRGIEFCLISHSHGDHAAHVKGVMRAGIDVYAPSDVNPFCDGDGSHRLHWMLAGGQENINGWSVKSFPCVHDVPCVGFLIARGPHKIVYVPDTLYSPVRFGPGVTHFLLSVNWSKETLSEDMNPAYRKHVVTQHLSLDTALNLLRANDLSSVIEIWLCHLSEGNSNAEMFKREIEKLTGKPVFIAQEAAGRR